MFYTLTIESEDPAELKAIVDAIEGAGVEGGPLQGPQSDQPTRTRRTKAQIEADKKATAAAAAPAAGSTAVPASTSAAPASASSPPAVDVFAAAAQPADPLAAAAAASDPLAAAAMAQIEVTLDTLRDRVSAAISKLGPQKAIEMCKQHGSPDGGLAGLPQASYGALYAAYGKEMGV